jgi:hypothetical protein
MIYPSDRSDVGEARRRAATRGDLPVRAQVGWFSRHLGRMQPKLKCVEIQPLGRHRGEEGAPLHSITRSARTRIVCGTLMASAFAVFRFTTSSTSLTVRIRPILLKNSRSRVRKFWVEYRSARQFEAVRPLNPLMVADVRTLGPGRIPPTCARAHRRPKPLEIFRLGTTHDLKPFSERTGLQGVSPFALREYRNPDRFEHLFGLQPHRIGRRKSAPAVRLLANP